MSDSEDKGSEAKQERTKFFLIFRKVWIPFACIAALLLGIMIGYVFIGKQSANEIFNLDTWHHLFDLVFADT